jgi:hypothetical protein
VVPPWCHVGLSSKIARERQADQGGTIRFAHRRLAFTGGLAFAAAGLVSSRDAGAQASDEAAVAEANETLRTQLEGSLRIS